MTVGTSNESVGRNDQYTNCWNSNGLTEPNSVNYVDLELLEIGISPNVKSKREDLSLDYLQVLLKRASPNYLTTKVVNDVEVEAPAVDLELPINHGYFLQLDDLIPVKLSNSTYVASSNDLLRPTTRLYCRLGRSLVAEQYRRIMPGRMRLHGVKPVKMSQEAHSMERELLQRTLPGAGVAIARLRWNWKDLEGLYEATCVQSGCCFETNSYEGLVGHLKMGHYRMEEILEEPEDSLGEVRSPCLYYPVNPARMREVVSTSKNFYCCRKCDVYFSSLKLIQAHCSEMHNGSRFESSEASVFDMCIFCGELVKKESSKLLVCRLHLQSKSPTFLWNEIGRYLHCDPARAIGAHALASLMLYPSEKSPLHFVKCVAERIQVRCEESLEDLSHRVTSALSAFRGSYHFSGVGAYSRILGKAVDIEEIDLQLRISSKRRQPTELMEEEESKKAKKPRLFAEFSTVADLKEQAHAGVKSSSEECLERRNKVIVIQNPFSGSDSIAEGKKSSQFEPPSILRVIRSPQQPKLITSPEQSSRPAGTVDAGGNCKNPFIVRPPTVVVVSESCSLPDLQNSVMSKSQKRCSLVFHQNTGSLEKNATVEGRERKSADSSPLTDNAHVSMSDATNTQHKTTLTSTSKVVILPKAIDSIVKVTSTLPSVICSPLDSSKQSQILPRVMTVTNSSPRTHCEMQKPIVLRITRSSDATKVTSVQSTVSAMSTASTVSTQDAASCGDVSANTRLASKIMGVNLTQSSSTASLELNPQGGYHLQVDRMAPSASSGSGSQVVRKSLSPAVWESVTSRNIAEEVAKKVAQSSTLSSLSFITTTESTPRRKQQLPSTSASSMVPKAADLMVNKDGSPHSSTSSVSLSRKPSSCATSSRKSVDDRPSFNIQPVIIRRRRARKHINVTASNGENSSEGPGPSYPFESPESVNLIANWLKRSGTDISKVKPSEIPQDIAALFGLKDVGAPDVVGERKDGYVCQFCEMSFDRIEILWAHCVRNHPEKKFSSECLFTSPPIKGDSVRGEPLNVNRTSVDCSASKRDSSSQRHSPTSRTDAKAVVKSLSVRSPSLLKGKRMAREPVERKSDEQSGQYVSVSLSSDSGSGKSSNFLGGEGEVSLMCPMCSFSSSSRDVIMKHVVESH